MHDPFSLLAPQLANVRKELLKSSGNPALPAITKCYFLHPESKLPVLVLLFSQTANGGDLAKKTFFVL